jgi:serine/threonine protein phosphatase PrpC
VSENIGPWKPVVVDKPILDFEPRPPADRPYSPDTICDGWSTDRIKLRMASVRGYSHRYRGTPRQDDAEVVYDLASDSVILAVADGISSAPHSHIGARVACRSAVDAIMRSLRRRGAGSVDWLEIMNLVSGELIREAAELLGKAHVTADAAADCLGTTLIAGYILQDAAELTINVARVGDSNSWMLKQDTYYPIFSVKNTDDLVSSVVSSLPIIPRDISISEASIENNSVLLLGSDGFGDPLGEGDGMVGELFADHLSAAPPPRMFAQLLDFSRETFDDDRTLVGIWPINLREG